eukprot:TRINITY_DN6734_c0_g1_i3.p1 TRINITY_DN6734_c0_g1~~TRINITY_DN6734_c0_g1_i3.p1  ORF type:complete len:396 (-),score=69.69 TRINITY_DN6734_c0_g1_i3:99-1286(-)
MKVTVVAVCIAVCCLLIIGTAAQNGYPFEIVTPQYNLTWLSPAPYPKISTSLHSVTGLPYQLMSFHPVSLAELHLPQDIYQHEGGNDFTKNIKTRALTVSDMPLEGTKYSSAIINEDSYYGIQSNTTLSNGAVFSFTITINVNTSLIIPIPRPNWTKPCENKFKFSPNCSCDATHPVDPNSIKMSFVVEDWPWEPLENTSSSNNTYVYRALLLKFSFISNFNLDYYFSAGDISNLVTSDVCDVLTIPFNISGGNITCPFSFFRFSFQDGVARTIYSLFDIADVVPGTGPGETGQYTFPLGVVFSEFNKTLVYDPDFSILFNNLPTTDGAAGQGDGRGQNTGGGNSDSMRIILIAVLVPIAALTVLAVVIGLIAFSVVKRKRLSQVMNSVHMSLEN